VIRYEYVEAGGSALLLAFAPAEHAFAQIADFKRRGELDRTF
jgi:hypothetical protein